MQLKYWEEFRNIMVRRAHHDTLTFSCTRMEKLPCESKDGRLEILIWKKSQQKFRPAACDGKF